MSAPPRRPTLRQILLGAFLLWQTFFLITANAATLTSGSLRRLLDGIDNPYAEAACQHQVWGQYAPNITRHAIFAAVELRWPDRTSVEIRSEAEESDPFSYVQNPTPYRVALYEGDLVRPLWGFTAQSMKDDPAAFRKEASEYVRSRARPIAAYLDWQRRKFASTHPDTAAPSECILRVHVWVVPPETKRPWTWPPPDDVPLARVRPGVTPPKGMLPVELYDPATGDFDFMPEVRAEGAADGPKGTRRESP